MSKYFKPNTNLTIKDVADVISATIVGKVDEEKIIEGINTLNDANPSEITFLSNHKYSSFVKDTKAFACIVNEDFKINDDNKHIPLLIVKDSYEAFAILLQKLYKSASYNKIKEGYDVISDRANISKNAKIGKNCNIEAGVFIGDNVSIGDNVYIGPNTVLLEHVTVGNNCSIGALSNLKYVKVGNNCIFHEGVKIGQDGFGFAPTSNGNIKIPQIGGVEIGDDVEIGANTCIDRGALVNTVIESGTKIDNLVQIGHNVRVGKNCFLAGQVGIAGSTKVGNSTHIGGQAGIAPHITIGDNVKIVPKTGVPSSVESSSVIAGEVARPFYEFWRLQSILNKLIKKEKK